jgi:hypothetical protein
VAIVLLAGISLIKVVLRSKKYDPIFVAISVGWLGYQLQSLISINQIGLAIWGWVLTGALIAYERNTRTSNVEEIANLKPDSKAKGKSRSRCNYCQPASCIRYQMALCSSGSISSTS